MKDLLETEGRIYGQNMAQFPYFLAHFSQEISHWSKTLFE